MNPTMCRLNLKTVKVPRGVSHQSKHKIANRITEINRVFWIMVPMSRQPSCSNSRIKSIPKRVFKMEGRWYRWKHQGPKISGLAKASRHRSRSNSRTARIIRECRTWAIAWVIYKQANMWIKANQWCPQVNHSYPQSRWKRSIRVHLWSPEPARGAWYRIMARKVWLTNSRNYQWVPQALKTPLRSISTVSRQQQTRHRLLSVSRSDSAR